MLAGMPISISAPHSHPAIINSEPRTDSTPPPQAVPAGTVPHVSANPTAAAAVVNGYISDPPPVPPNVVSRSILNSRTFKTPQPAHTSLGVHKNVTNMPAPDVSHPLSNLGKSGAGTSSLPILHGSLPPHSYNIGPSLASVPPGHVMGLNPVNFPASNTLQLGSQPPPVSSLMPEGSSAYPVLMYSHPRGILTSIANSMPVMTSTQSHHAGPPMSHSPSPAAAAVCADQLLTAPYIAETPNRPEGSSLTPPAQAPVLISSLKSQTGAGGTNSGTPSPPLVPAAPKQVGTNESQPPGRGPPYVGFYNGYLPPIIYPQGHQPPQHFPNGVTSEYGWLRFPHQLTSNYLPFVYGSVFSHQNLPGTLHATLSSGGPAAAAANQSHTGGGASSKTQCYNCGQTGHKASDCEESRMENMSSKSLKQ